MSGHWTPAEEQALLTTVRQLIELPVYAVKESEFWELVSRSMLMNHSIGRKGAAARAKYAKIRDDSITTPLDHVSKWKRSNRRAEVRRMKKGIARPIGQRKSAYPGGSGAPKVRHAHQTGDGIETADDEQPDADHTEAGKDEEMLGPDAEIVANNDRQDVAHREQSIERTHGTLEREHESIGLAQMDDDQVGDSTMHELLGTSTTEREQHADDDSARSRLVISRPYHADKSKTTSTILLNRSTTPPRSPVAKLWDGRHLDIYKVYQPPANGSTQQPRYVPRSAMHIKPPRNPDNKHKHSGYEAYLRREEEERDGILSKAWEDKSRVWDHNDEQI